MNNNIINLDPPVICKRCTKWEKTSERSRTKKGNVMTLCNACITKKKQDNKIEAQNWRTYKKIIPLRFQANYKKGVYEFIPEEKQPEPQNNERVLQFSN